MISIRNTMGWLAGLTIAAAGMFGGAAPAQAQQLVKFAEVESQGGFVAWSDKVTMLAQLNAAGRITGGRVQVERVVRRGATPGTLVMTGKMGAAETHSLWTAIYAAKPWQYTQVRARNGNTDFPNTKVTYMGRYAQTIIAGYITPPRLPLVSAEMERFTGLAWDLDRKTAEIEAEILAHETEIESLQARMILPDTLRDGRLVRQLQDEIARRQAQLSTLYEHWEEAAELN